MPKIQITAGQINYEWINVSSSSDEVLVFLHEALGSIGQWKDFPKLLCESLQLNGLVYDRLGYGKSSDDTRIRDSSYLEDFAFVECPQVIDQLIPHKKIHLIGHSDGGSIALIYASSFQSKVASVTTMAAHIFVENVTLAGIDPAIEAFEKGKLDGLRKYHGDKTEHLFYNWARTWLSEEYLNWNIESYLSNIKASCLIIQGANDQYGTEAQVDGIVSQVSGKALKKMIPNCGHAPHLESKQVVLDEIKAFIENIK